MLSTAVETSLTQHTNTGSNIFSACLFSVGSHAYMYNMVEQTGFCVSDIRVQSSQIIFKKAHLYQICEVYKSITKTNKDLVQVPAMSQSKMEVHFWTSSLVAKLNNNGKQCYFPVNPDVSLPPFKSCTIGKTTKLFLWTHSY